MAQKKVKAKASSDKGVVGLLKKFVGGGKTKKASAPKRSARKTAPPKKSKPKANAKQANPKLANAKSTPNGKAAAPAPPVKKKPPSITITRPEVTRPPVVLPPPRPLEAPIGAPNILLPKGGLPITSLTPILRWMYVGGATRYEVEWSHDAHFGRGHSITLVSTQTAISLNEANQLKPGLQYRWRVRGGNDAGWGPWSPPETFVAPER